MIGTTMNFLSMFAYYSLFEYYSIVTADLPDANQPARDGNHAGL